MNKEGIQIILSKGLPDFLKNHKNFLKIKININFMLNTQLFFLQSHLYEYSFWKIEVTWLLFEVDSNY